MPASPSIRRPPPLFLSKSLEGLEKVIPPEGYSASSSPTPTWKFDKPLPKTPQTPSSIYSVDIRSSDRSENPLFPRAEKVPANTRSYPGSPGDKLSNSSYFSETNLLRPVAFSNTQPSSPLAQSHRPTSEKASTPETCYGDDDHDLIRLGPYANDERDGTLQVETKQEQQTRDVARRMSGTEPITPSMQTAVEGVDAVLVPLPLECQSLHCNCSNRSFVSLSGIERGVSNSGLRSQKSQPILRRVMSEEGPPKHDEENGHVTWLTSSFSTLPSSKYSQGSCYDCSHSISRHSSADRRGRPGNRTPLYSFSSGTSQQDSDGSELCKCARQRTRHVAIPQSEYQKYGPNSFTYPREKRSSTFPRYISRLLPEPIRGRLSVNTACSPPQTPSLPSPRRPPTPSPLGINRTPALPPSTWRESALRWRSNVRLTTDKIKMPKNLDARGKERVKSRIVVLGGSSNRGTGERWASRWF